MPQQQQQLQQQEHHQQQREQRHHEQQQQQGSIILPVEILQAIGAFLDPFALHRACNVNRFWCQCLRPGLWRDIPDRALVSRTFIDQFAHYAHYIHHLTLLVPHDIQQIHALVNLHLTGDPTRIAESTPPKTLLDCVSLVSIEIDLQSSYSNLYPDDLAATYSINLSPICLLLEQYANRLRKVSLLGLRESYNNKFLQAVQGMKQLSSLSLLQWEYPDLDILYEILLNCQGLRTLTLEISDGISVTQLRRLKDWRSRYDSTLKSLAADGTATGGDDRIDDPSCFRLTGIKKLVLDQSVVNIDLVMLLCGVMPNLHTLSMKETGGLVENISFFDDEQDLMDVQTAQAEGVTNVDFADFVSHNTDDDEDEGDGDESDGDYYGEGEPNATDEEADEEAEEEEQEAEEEEMEEPGTEGTGLEAIAPVNILTGAPYSDNDEDEDYDDYDDSYSNYDEYDYDEYDYLYDGNVNIVEQEDFSFRALNALRQACPQLKHFDFSGCSSEMQEEFFVHLLKLWGENMEGLLARETCLFSESTFDLVASLGQNLVHLDLSFKGSTRPGGISRGVYYDSVLGIFESCPLLESLFVAPYVIDAKEIASREIPWVCVKLRHLSICVEYRLDPHSDNDQDRHQESARILRKVYRQLARLSGLRTLVIQGGCDTMRRAAAVRARGRPMGDGVAGPRNHDRCLEFRLEFGLDQLSTWKCLKLLDMSGLDPHGMKENDLAWIAREWPALERIEGFYPATELEVIANSQRNKVDEAIEAQMRENEHRLSSEESTDGLDFTNRAELRQIWQCRAPLLPEAMICASGRLKSLENSRLEVIVDESVLERTFAMHDLKIFDQPRPSYLPPPVHVTEANPQEAISDTAPHARRVKEKESIVDQASASAGEQDRSHEPTVHPVKRYVGYARSPLSAADELSLKRRPGGIANDELMANVMRPRQEGRSPSPLGTWY